MRRWQLSLIVAVAGAAAGVLGTLAFMWWNPWPPEPDGSSSYAVTCTPDRDRCWQGGQKVEAPDFYEDCKPETEGGYAGVWLAGEGTDEQTPFDYVYACLEAPAP